MTDIREIVARVILKAVDGDANDVTHVLASRDAADAALSACGYLEMREALEKQSKFMDALCTVADELFPHVSARVIKEHTKDLRAALAKANPGGRDE